MSITAERYNFTIHRREWEEFTKRCTNATMFHHPAFLDYHDDGKFEFHHIIFRCGNEIIAFLPGGFFQQNSKEYWSPTGASYGSFIADDISFERSLEVVDCFLAYGKTNGWSDAYIIPPPIIYSDIISQHFEYAMLYRLFDFELHYISHAIQLQHKENFVDHFDKTARKTIRKILRENEIRICDSDDYATFHAILVANKAKHNAKPTHSLDDLLRLRELMPDKLRLMMVYHGDTPIAGSLLFLTNRNVVLCFYNMLLYEYEHLKPIYLIMYETIRRAYREGYRWVDIGVSQDTKDPNPMTPSLGLIGFKERFTARGILRSTYHIAF